MGDLPSFNNGVNGNEAKAIAPKPEILDFELSGDRTYAGLMHVGDNNASSSGSNLRSSLIGMGFSASLVNKVIEEKGEEDVELLVETLIGYNDLQKSNSQSSDSLDSLFDDKDANNLPETSTMVQAKEEPDVMDEGVHIEKRASLLMMNFSVNEVDFALDKLGKDAHVYELVDFITAAQISENLEKETDNTSHDNEGINEVLNDVFM